MEVCTSISSVKYLYKYIYKGHDRLNAALEMHDEILAHIDARYISAMEACYRNMRFELQAKTHTVTTLPIHLKHQQNVCFHPGESAATILNRSNHTMLTQFFLLAANDEIAKTLLYHDLPIYYRYCRSKPSQRQPWHEEGHK